MAQNTVQPRLIIHGGAGNISPSNLSPKQWAVFKRALLRIQASGHSMLIEKDAAAIDVATHAVAMFEDETLWNCGKGAVFTRDGTVELEASIMTTRGYHKRACGVTLLKHVKNPIKLAREMLVRGDSDAHTVELNAQGHVFLSGHTAESLARLWGLQMVDQSYFWTKKRWEQHRRGLKEASLLDLDDSDGVRCHASPDNHSGRFLDGREYLPQGTVGCVVLDRRGTICVATSTGGLTNKLAGRIGDTPTIGAGFWAEQWTEKILCESSMSSWLSSLKAIMPLDCGALTLACSGSVSKENDSQDEEDLVSEKRGDRNAATSTNVHSLAMSGTGDGDYFLRLAAARTAGATVRFDGKSNLSSAISWVVGPGGQMQRAAGRRWGNGEGEGGMIGIEFKHGRGQVSSDFNCGGMFRCWAEEDGTVKVAVFRKVERCHPGSFADDPNASEHSDKAQAL